MAKPLSGSLGGKNSHFVSSETIPVNYSSTRGAQFINSTVTGNTLIWQNHPASPQTPPSCWFSDIKYWLHHKITCKDLLENSGNWLLEKNAFKQWKDGPASSVLWLHGIPGSGKTKLVAQIINHLQPSLPAGSFAYFYCLRSAAEDERSRPEEVIRSILRQLAFAGTDDKVLKEPAAKKYEAKKKEAKEHCSDEIDKLTLQECVQLLVELLKDASTVIIIDALDELKKDDRWILYEALDAIQEELKTGIVRILISSRDDGDIKMKLSCYPNVYIKATDNKDDVQQFVIQEVGKAIKNCRLLRGSVSIDLKADIISTLIEGAQGMFRWVSLQIQALCGSQMKTTSAVRKALGRLPSTLEESYDVVYKQMLDTDPETVQKSEIVIRFLLCAKRQLSTSEFIGAVYASSCSLKDTSPVNADEELLSVEEILDICCNLVVWDPTLDTFRAAHLSVREYFEKKPHFGRQDIHAHALEACINTLLGLVNQQNTAGFKLYATTYWPNHCAEVGLQGPVGPLKDKIMQFLFKGHSASDFYLDWAKSLGSSVLEPLGKAQPTAFEQVVRLYEAYNVLKETLVGLRSIVFLASVFNLPWILMPLMQIDTSGPVAFNHQEIFGPRPDRDSALGVAAMWGSLEIAQKLLDLSVDVNAQGHKGWVPLHRAAQRNHLLVAEALIKSGANLNALSDDGRGFMPLHEAIWNNSPDMVDLFMKNGANIEARDNKWLTPLLLAVKESRENVIAVLLKWDADMSATDRNGDTAFFLAAERHEQIFMSFIQSGKIPESLFGGSALCSATRSCSIKSVQTLVERGIDVNSADRFQRCPLDYALEQGFSQAISFLIGHSAHTSLNWNLSSYYVEQWKSETWFPTLVQSLTSERPAKLAPYILSISPSKVCRKDLIAVSEDSPQVPYILIRIPDSFTSVSRIEFSTESHDQGFSNDAQQWGGTYEHSWTWFEVAVLPRQSLKSSGSLRYPPPRRHLQSNVHASRDFKVHRNSWDSQDEDVEKQEWLRFLRPGDVVQLIPRALYPDWVNYINRAEIEIFNSTLKPLAVRPGLSPSEHTNTEPSTDGLL